MSGWRWLLGPIALVIAFLSNGMPGSAQAPLAVHGADSLFRAPSIRLAWAVLRGPSEEETKVVIRLTSTGGEFRYVRVDGVDPFTKSRTVLVESRPLQEQADLSVPRARFAEFPSCEIYLFGSEDASRVDQPALMIYYLGVPDTTPEFASDQDLRAYFETMLGTK